MMISSCSSSPKVLQIPEIELPVTYRIAFPDLPDLKSGLSNDVLIHHIGAISQYNECRAKYKGLLDFY